MSEMSNDDNEMTTRAPIRTRRFDSPRKARIELSRLYFDLRNGRVTPKEAGTGAYILSIITKALEVEIIEQRLAALEERAEAAQAAQGGPQRENPRARH